jgi:hypothetical protein
MPVQLLQQPLGRLDVLEPVLMVLSELPPKTPE